MSERKKYIGKKRQKIFSIEKNDVQTPPKQVSNKKINLSPKNNLIPPKEIQHPSPQKLCLNLDKKKDKINTESQKHSLISISKLVFEYIKKVVYTTGNEVTEHIKNILHSKKNDRLNQKNIQRRVYDAINVMCAVGLIKKNKQKIQFLQNDSEEGEDNSNKELNINEKEKINIEGKIKDKLYELEEKRKKLAKNYIKLKFYEKYSFLNNNLAQNQDKNKLEFPFDIITYDNSSPIKISSKEDSSRYLILSNTVLLHLTPYDIIKKLIAPDILLKLNENNFIDCKSSSKKSTNDNSIIDEVNYNINNNEIHNLEKKEKRNEQNSQGNKLLSRNYTDINYEQETPGKTKEEKGEELVFDYLKDKKCFLDELLNNKESNEELINVEISDVDKSREERENIIEKEKENENPFNENGLRKNSNLSNESNFFDENTIKRNKCDLISEIEMFK